MPSLAVAKDNCYLFLSTRAARGGSGPHWAGWGVGVGLGWRVGGGGDLLLLQGFVSQVMSSHCNTCVSSRQLGELGIGHRPDARGREVSLS